jgi:hypothetical protein
VQEVVSEAAEQDVVGVPRPPQRSCRSTPLMRGIRLKGVRSTVFLSAPAGLSVATWTCPGVVITRLIVFGQFVAVRSRRWRPAARCRRAPRRRRSRCGW